MTKFANGDIKLDVQDCADSLIGLLKCLRRCEVRSSVGRHGGRQPKILDAKTAPMLKSKVRYAGLKAICRDNALIEPLRIYIFGFI